MEKNPDQGSSLPPSNRRPSTPSDVTASALITHGTEWNRDWMSAQPNENLLRQQWKIMHSYSEAFVRTSCEVTAMMIRWKTGSSNVSTIESCVTEEMSFADAINTFGGRFQFYISESWEGVEHVATVWEGWLIQSYFNKYTIKATLIDAEILSALEDMTKPGAYEKVTGVPPHIPVDKLKIFYWPPLRQDDDLAGAGSKTKNQWHYHPGTYRIYPADVVKLHGYEIINHWTCCMSTDEQHPGCRHN